MYRYCLKRSARKTLALEITRSLTVLVRAPVRLPKRDIDRFVEAHSDWIARHLETQRLRADAGLYGELSAEEEEWLRAKAQEELPQRVRYFGALMGLRPAGIRITGAKTRFGSCSGKNSLCFSYRLMRYPPQAVDLVVVHELAHIRHKNHGPEFYACVSAVLPDYRERRRLLTEPNRQNGGTEMALALEQWRPELIPSVARYANNRNIADNLRDGFPHPYTQDDAEAYVTGCIRAGDARQLCRAVTANGETVGSIGVFLRDQGEAELGYWLAEPFWGRGIMTWAVTQLCLEAFSRFELRCIFAVPYARNQASRRVLEKTGFRFEGLTESCGCTRGQVCRYVLANPRVP